MDGSNGIDPNAGAPVDGGSGVPNDGAQGGNPSNAGAPSNQGGNQPDPWAAKEKQYQDQIKALNKAVIESRRSGGNSNRQPAAPGTDDPQDQLSQQYAMAIEVAENRLRSGIEPVFGLYPEVPAKIVSQIRSNPWAFSSRQSFLSGDFETAKMEIEQYLLDLAEEGKPTDGQGANQPAPANLSNNPTPGNQDDPANQPEENLWAMPIDQLEKLKEKELAKASRKS